MPDVFPKELTDENTSFDTYIFANLEKMVDIGILSPDIFTEFGKKMRKWENDGTVHRYRHRLPDNYCPKCRGHGCFTTFAFPDGSGAEYEDCVHCGGTGRI